MLTARCRFSPLSTTGHRYLYTGFATGHVVIYDLLTGSLVTKLGPRQVGN